MSNRQLIPHANKHASYNNFLKHIKQNNKNSTRQSFTGKSYFLRPKENELHQINDKIRFMSLENKFKDGAITLPTELQKFKELKERICEYAETQTPAEQALDDIVVLLIKINKVNLSQIKAKHCQKSASKSIDLDKFNC